MAAEAVLRLAYNSPSLQPQPFYATSFAVDRGHLAGNAVKVMGKLAASASFPFLMVGTAGAGVAAILLWRSRGGNTSGREVWRLDGAALVLTFWAMAAAQVPMLILVRHVRLGMFLPRYFTLVYIFGSLAGLLALAWAAASLAARRRRWREALALAGAAGVAFGVLRVPSPNRGREVPITRVAARLEALAPGEPLLGGFWNTYTFAARQRPGTMLIPVPCERRSQYTPWWQANLRRAPRVLVVQTTECEGFGTPDSPAPWIHEHGTLLRLSRPHVAAGAGLTFSFYENVTARALPRTAVPADTAWRYCLPGAALRLSFAPRERALVFAARAGRTQAASLFAAPVLADGTVAAPVQMRRTGRLYRADLRGERSPLVGVRITARLSLPIEDLTKCQGVRAYVMAGDSVG
jgi:hypothetical protein